MVPPWLRRSVLMALALAVTGCPQGALVGPGTVDSATDGPAAGDVGPTPTDRSLAEAPPADTSPVDATLLDAPGDVSPVDTLPVDALPVDTLADAAPPDGATADVAPGLDGALSKGIPCGFWGMVPFSDTVAGLVDVKSRFKATVFQAASSDPAWTVGTFLPRIKAAGMTVTLRMTGGHSHYTTANGSFDLASWKARLAPWAGSGVQPFIDDGTLIGHMLLDDITNFSGTDPTADDLEQMAKYSKQLMPGLMTFVRRHATGMPTPPGGKYLFLDACVNQYKVHRGEVVAWAASERSKALSLGLGVINGLNLPDGGDGSSGQPGYLTGKFAMSAAEISTYGAALLAIPECGMFLSWEYDGKELWSDGSIGSDYLDQPAIQAALAGLHQQAAQHPAVQLLKP